MSKYPVVGIVMATLLEADPFIGGLSLSPCEKNPFPVYENKRIRLIISGIGKANAAMASACLILKFQPLGVLNLGAAGSTCMKPLGECYHITKVIEPDRPDLKSGEFHVHVPQIYDGFRTATLATRDKPVTDDLERREVSLYAQLADMEGASVVQTCERFHTECYLFKFVSDSSNDDECLDIKKNIEQYRDAFYKFFCDSVLPCLMFDV